MWLPSAKIRETIFVIAQSLVIINYCCDYCIWNVVSKLLMLNKYNGIQNELSTFASCLEAHMFARCAISITVILICVSTNNYTFSD